MNLLSVRSIAGLKPRKVIVMKSVSFSIAFRNFRPL